MQSFLQDIGFGIRMLRKSPAFTTAAVLILGLGIGANTIIFSIVNALVFRPLPYRDASRLVFISAGNDRLKTSGPVSYPDYRDCKEQNRLLEEAAAFLPDAVNWTGAGEPERLRVLRASADLIPLLGLSMKMGRALLETDCTSGAEPVALVSNGFWQRRFGSRPDITGLTVTVDGRRHTVAGVLGPQARMGFLLGFEPDLWLPLLPPNPPRREYRNLGVVARLRTGVSLEQSQGEMAVITGRLEKQYPASNKGWRVLVSDLRAKVDPIAYVLLAALVASVLGIACTNVANLVLARSCGRVKEIAIRGALGAGRRRVLRQLLTESLLLAFLGSCLGVLIAFGACDLIRAASGGSNMDVVDVRPDALVLAGTFLLLLLTTIAVGLAPALKCSSGILYRSLKEGSPGSSGGSSGSRAGSFLAASEIALSFLLLVGGGLAIKSWFSLWHVDSGYRPENVLTMKVSLTDAKYQDAGRRAEFFQNLLERLRTHPEIQSAGIASAPPTKGPQSSFTFQGSPRPDAGEEPVARCTSASPSYFETMAIPLRGGRLFSDRDTSNSLPVVVVNDALVRKYCSDRNPIGSTIEVWGKPRVIIGFIADLREAPLALKARPEIYLPYAQNPGSLMMLAMRTTGDLLSVANAVRTDVRTLNPNQPLERLETMDRIRAHDVGVITLGSRLLVLLGACALILAAVGLYGVLSYSVSRRSAEFGIRMALGAAPGQILRLVLKQGTGIALFGLVPGIAAAGLLTRVLARAFYGVTAMEPGILCGLAALLTMVSLLAGYIPARRATRVDPMAALRSE
jgi:putative ABC transport system permease protein